MPRGSNEPLALDRTQTLAPRGDAAMAATAVGTDPGPGDDDGPHDDGGDDRYELIGEHARGGLGRVVRAHDRHLGRTVAVKELLRKSDLAESMFVREAMITARLEHPGIVPVHEAGRWPNGDPYYVMKLVSGRTLKEVMGDARTLGDRLALLPHLIAVAEAVGYAHSESVIHRDLKPANVLVGEFGETVVIDWGLARDLRSDDTALPCELAKASPPDNTVTGRVIGTPQYMAPEQARGEAVGASADVYALGAMLYELLAGHPPVEGDSVKSLLDQVHAGPPRPLAAVAPGVPADLEAIVAKAMARVPADRYPTARELAADLKRFQTGQLVTAQRYSRRRLLKRWLWRHRAYVGTAAMAMIAIALVAAGQVNDLLDDRRVAQERRQRAEAVATTAVEGETKLILTQARASVASDPTETVAWLKQYPLTQAQAGRIRALLEEAEANGVASQAWRIGERPTGVILSDDGARVVVPTRDGWVRVHDTATGAVRRLGEAGPAISSVVFAPGSTDLFVADVAGRLARLDGATGARTELGQTDGSIVGLWALRDGGVVLRTPRGVWRRAAQPGAEPIDLFPGINPVARGVATWDDRTATLRVAHGIDGKIRVWRGDDGPVEVATISGVPSRLAITDDGKAAIVGTTAAVYQLDLPTGAVHPLCDVPAEINRITIDPTQRRAAVVTKAADVYLVDLATHTVELKRGHTDGVYTAAFDARGERMVTASDDGTVRIWDLPTGDVRELRGHRDDVMSALVSRDGHTVLSASVDDTMRVWRVDDRRTRVVGHLDDVRKMASLGGERVRVLSSGEDKGVRVIDVDLRARTAVERLHDRAAITARGELSEDGAVAFFQRGPLDVAVWRDGALQELRLPPELAKLSPARTGTTFVGVDVEGHVRRLDARGDVRIARAEPTAWASTSPDGKLAIVQDRTRFQLIDVETGAERASLARADLNVLESAGAFFLPTGDRVLIASGVDSGVDMRLWDPDTDRIITLAGSSNGYKEMAVSPDRRALAGGIEARAVRVWDLETGAERATLRGHRDGVFSMAFSPDGRRLATASYDRTVRIWDLATAESQVLSGHAGPVWSVLWLDDARVVSAGADGTVRLWDVPVRPTPDVEELRRRLDGLSAVVIGPEQAAMTPPLGTP